ncbi:hypothetical protein C4579_00870 [Candidatus Microgenomates bacterium]|nr:MAG: hypothetical protein C4579_00870 [Candidatus Microgenomates bacterium]
MSEGMLHSLTGAHFNDWLDHAVRYIHQPDDRRRMLATLSQRMKTAVSHTLTREKHFDPAKHLNLLSLLDQDGPDELSTRFVTDPREHGSLVIGITTLPRTTRLHVLEGEEPKSVTEAAYEVAADPGIRSLVVSPPPVDRSDYTTPLLGRTESGNVIKPLVVPQGELNSLEEQTYGGIVINTDGSFEIVPFSLLQTMSGNKDTITEQAIWITTRETYQDLLEQKTYQDFSKPFGLIGYFEGNDRKQNFVVIKRHGRFGMQQVFGLLNKTMKEQGFESWKVACTELGNSAAVGVQHINQETVEYGPVSLIDNYDQGHRLRRFYIFHW